MKWWGWIIVALVVLWAVHHSAQASADVHGIGGFIAGLVD